MTEKLVGVRRQTVLKELHGWSEVLERDAIRKTFHFADFTTAWGFMSQVALLAVRMDHIPQWLNDDGRVEIVLFTRAVDGVTGRDVEFARRIDALAPPHDQ